jgi:hypothetical protein
MRACETEGIEFAFPTDTTAQPEHGLTDDSEAKTFDIETCCFKTALRFINNLAAQEGL